MFELRVKRFALFSRSRRQHATSVTRYKVRHGRQLAAWLDWRLVYIKAHLRPPLTRQHDVEPTRGVETNIWYLR